MTIHCNRCNKPFESNEFRTNQFFGQAATRATSFIECPHCSQTDVHWFFASDEMPKFEGSTGQIKRQQETWLEDN